MAPSSPTPRPRFAVARALVIGWVVLVLVHVWIARGVTGPVVLHDEMGYLGNARWLAGLQPVPEMGDAAFYTWGYSALLAPLTLLIDDPALLYRGVQLVNAMLLASLLPLLWWLTVELTSLDRRRALVPAALGAVFPATLVHSSMAWTESLLPPLLVLLMLAVAWALDEHRPAWQRWLVAPLAVALYATHGRTLPALALVTVGLVFGAGVGRVPRTTAAAGVATIGIGFLVAGRLNAALVDARWPEQVITAGSIPRLLGRLVNPLKWPGLIGEIVGEAWYLSVGSFGLAAIGVLAVLWQLWSRRPKSFAFESDDDRRWLAVGFGVAVLAGLFVTSAVSFVGSAERVDQLFYGRYNEAFAPILLAAGVVALLSVDVSVRARLIGLAAAFTVGFGAILWLGRGPGAFDGEIVWPMILAVRVFAEPAGQELLVPVGTAATVLAAVGLWLLGPRRAIAMGVLAVAMVASAVIAVRPLAAFADVLYDGWRLPSHLARVAEAADADHLTVDRTDPDVISYLVYPYWSPSLDHRLGPEGTPTAATGLVVADVDAGLPDGRIAVLDGRHGLAVWAVPGPDAAFEELERRGALLPAGFPARLPDSARRAAIERAGGSSPVTVPGGDSVALDIAVTHAGAGAPWPSDFEWPLPGVVRVGVRWYDADGRVVRSSDWAPLPGPMWPGDRAETTIVAVAADADGRPLAPGRYTVGVELLQAGIAWFADDGAEPLRFEVEVTAR